MEISLDKVKTRSDSYQLFLDPIRSPSTLRRYQNQLFTFLKLIPNQLYTDTLGKSPKDRKVTKHGSLKTTLFGGESLVIEIIVSGTVYFQTRNIMEFVRALIPFLPRRN